MSGIGWRVWRRRMAVDRLLVAAIALSVLVAAVSLGAVPRVFEQASVDDLRHTVATAEPERRNVRLSHETRIAPASDDPFESIRMRGDALLDALPAPLAEVVSGRGFVVDSPPFRVTSYPERRQGPFPTRFRFRAQDGVDAESELIAGRMPAAHEPLTELAGAECPSGEDAVDGFVPDDTVDCERIEIPVVETALTRQTAADMQVDVGDMVTLTPDQSDLRWQLSGSGDLRVVLLVSGLVELSDVDREFWYADNRLHAARITETADFRLVEATGLLAPEQYAAVYRDVPRVEFDHAWRLFVDADRFDVELADDVAIALANAELDPVVLTTDLPDLVDEFRRQRTIVLVLLSTVVAGLAVVVAAAVAALTRLLAVRRLAATSLVVARGAGAHQLVLDAIRTAAVIVVPPVVAGGLVAWAAFPSTASGPSNRVLAVLAAACLVAVVGALHAAGDRDGNPLSRVVVDATVVVAAVAAVFMVRRRGDVSADGIAEVDLLLAVTPALAAVAVALVLIRLIGPAARLLARLAERRPGVASFVGLRQLVSRPGAARSATGVMVIAVGVAVFASAVHSSITTARTATSWYEVGADATVEAQISGAPLPIAVDDVPGLDAAGSARRLSVDRTTVRFGPDSATVDVVAIESAAYAELLADAPIDRPPLDLLADAAADRPAALVSTAWPRARPPTLGDELALDIGAGVRTYTLAGTAVTFPGVRAGRPFIVIDLSAADPLGTLRPTALHLTDRVAGAVEEVPFTRVLRRGDVVDELAADPLTRWSIRVLRLVAVLAGLFAGVAAVTAVAISVIARARDLAVLRTLGLRLGQGSAMTAVEQLPVLAVAGLGGVAVGTVSARLLRTALGLARFAGPGRPVTIRSDPFATLTTAGLVTIAMAIAVAISIRIQRRRDLAATLRVGDTT